MAIGMSHDEALDFARKQGGFVARDGQAESRAYWNRWLEANADDETPRGELTDSFKAGYASVTGGGTSLSMDEGGIIITDDSVDAELHPNEAVIPLDSPEGTEALSEAVSEAVDEAVTEAVAESITHTSEVIAEAETMAETNIETAVRNAFQAVIPELANAVHEAVNGNGNEEPEIIVETPVEESPEEVAPARDHWLTRRWGR